MNCYSTIFWKGLLFSFFLSLSTLSIGQDSLATQFDCAQISSNYPEVSLFDYTRILLDSNDVFQIEDVLTFDLSTKFQPLKTNTINANQTFWLYTKICSNVELDKWWLIFKRDTSLSEYVTHIEDLKMYYVQEKKVIREENLGTYAPAKLREIPVPHSVNRTFVTLEKGQSIELYFRLRSTASVSTEIVIRDPKFELPYPNTGLFRAIIPAINFSFILGIYVLMFFFYTRDISYLYLFFMFVCMYLHYFIILPYAPIVKWFIPNHPKQIEPLFFTLTMGTMLFFLLFGRAFSDLKFKMPKWDKLIKWNAILIFGLIFITIYLYNYQSEYLEIARIVSYVLCFVFPLIIVIRLAFYKDVLLRYYVVGALWMFIFSIIGLLYNFGVIPRNPWINPFNIAQIGLMIIYAFALAFKIKISERNRLEAENIKQIDAIKSRFFANISHEFRTPLSLILGPINNVLESIPSSEEVSETKDIPISGRMLQMMKRNALRLQQLIDQVLDLSKMDQGKMELKVAKGDLVQYLRALVFSFESLAESKHITFNTQFPKSISNALYDANQLEKIITNLLSNAIKFTPEHGSVTASFIDSNGKLKIEISDTAGGIESSEINQIFDRFYQVEGTHDQGTGIGLALVKEIVELYKGQIGVDSTIGKGTTFKISIPYLEKDFLPHQIIVKENKSDYNQEQLILENSFDLETNKLIGKSSAPLLLIVEDNTDLLQFIASQFQESYNIILASDGKEGLDLALQHLPDIIISDVMMPKMNGIELCNTIKSDIKTSHIPLILLTAKAGKEAKIEGLIKGADDYVIKPFDARELLVRVNNLITSRAQLKAKFTNEFKIGPSKLEMESQEVIFLNQVIAEIEKNIDNEYYSVEELSSAVGFSKSQLNRKIKALTDKTSNQLVREFRLTRAKSLLQQKSGSVSEIAYQVGYSNLSYFSKSYKELFGILPSETT